MGPPGLSRRLGDRQRDLDRGPAAEAAPGPRPALSRRQAAELAFGWALAFVLAAAVGGGVGGLATSPSPTDGGRRLTLAAAWALAFAVGSWLAMVAGMILGEVLKRALTTEIFGRWPGCHRLRLPAGDKSSRSAASERASTVL